MTKKISRFSNSRLDKRDLSISGGAINLDRQTPTDGRVIFASFPVYLARIQFKPFVSCPPGFVMAS